MKKLIISGVFCAVAVLGVSQAALAEESTTTTSPSSKVSQIEKLMKIIADLKTKMDAAKNEIRELATDLSEGAEGDDVLKVQEILATDPSIFGAKPTGFFGPKTKEALAKFQERYGLEATGRLDEATREAMKELRKDGKVAPGLLKSALIKDRIHGRLKAKWGDYDFTLPLRAAVCEKVKDGHGDKDDNEGEDEDGAEVTREDARKAAVDAQKEIKEFRAEVKDMKDGDSTKEDISAASDTLRAAQKEMVKARRALAKKQFTMSLESSNKVMELLEDEVVDEDEDEEDDD